MRLAGTLEVGAQVADGEDEGHGNDRHNLVLGDDEVALSRCRP